MNVYNSEWKRVRCLLRGVWSMALLNKRIKLFYGWRGFNLFLSSAPPNPATRWGSTQLFGHDEPDKSSEWQSNYRVFSLGNCYIE